MSEVIVTGASRGLGADLVRLLVARGEKVTATYSGATAHAEIAEVNWRQCDLADLESVRAFVSSLPETSFRVIHAAAFDPRTDHRYGVEKSVVVARSLDVNGTGSYALLELLSEKFEEHMSIAVIGSEAIYAPNQGSAAYAAGKAALKVLTAGLTETFRGRDGAVFEVLLSTLDSAERQEDVRAASLKTGISGEQLVSRALSRSNPESRIRRFITAADCLKVLDCGFELGHIANGASFRLDGGTGGVFR